MQEGHGAGHSKGGPHSGGGHGVGSRGGTRLAALPSPMSAL
jgi:hypothetical protein